MRISLFIPTAVIVAALLLIPLNSNSQNNCRPQQDRLLMIGDSWYGFMWGYHSYPIAFDKYGFPDMADNAGGPVLPGLTLELVVDPFNLTLIEQTISNNPQVDIVGLCLSGNDWLAGWDADMWPFQENAFFNTIKNRLNTLVNHILSIRPDIQILFSGYDFINLVETRMYPFSPYQAQWENMGEPSVLELNMSLARMEQLKIDIANANTRVHYVQSMGLMQYIYGYPIGLPVAPYLPFDPGVVPYPGQEADGYQPYPGGFIYYPTPMVALNWEGLDGIHFTEEAYQHLADHQTRYFFFDYFRDNPGASFIASSASSGWVAGDGSTGMEAIRVGELTSGTEYRALLSFDTGDLPDDVVIEKASIFLTRSGLTGMNPFGGDAGNNYLDIRSGNFGSAGLGSDDFFAPADAGDIGCFRGSVNGNGYKLRIDIDQDALDRINTSGTTEFRLAYDNSPQLVDALMQFKLTGGDAPILDVHYNSTTGITGSFIPEDNVTVYPNPSTGIFEVEWKGGSPGTYDLKIYDALGRIVYQKKHTDSPVERIDLRNMAPATYFLTLDVNEGRCVKRLLVYRD